MDSQEFRVANRLRVAIADDNPAMLDAVKCMLESDFQVIATLNESCTVVDKVVQLKPDILVLDISMGELNGFEITRRLKSDHCRSKIVFLTVHEELDFIRAAFDAGASGYVFKSRMNTDLRTAVVAAGNERVFIPDAPIPQADLTSDTS